MLQNDFTKQGSTQEPTQTEESLKEAMKPQEFAWSPDQSKQVLQTLKTKDKTTTQLAYKTAINQQVVQLKSQLKRLQNELATEKDEISQLNSQINSHKSSAQAAQQQAASLSSQISGLQKDVENAKYMAQVAQQQIEARASSMPIAQGGGDSLEGRILSWAKPGQQVDLSSLASVIGSHALNPMQGQMTQATADQLATSQALESQRLEAERLAKIRQNFEQQQKYSEDTLGRVGARVAEYLNRTAPNMAYHQGDSQAELKAFQKTSLMNEYQNIMNQANQLKQAYDQAKAAGQSVEFPQDQYQMLMSRAAGYQRQAETL